MLSSIANESFNSLEIKRKKAFIFWLTLNLYIDPFDLFAIFNNPLEPKDDSLRKQSGWCIVFVCLTIQSDGLRLRTPKKLLAVSLEGRTPKYRKKFTNEIIMLKKYISIGVLYVQNKIWHLNEKKN